MSRKFDPSASHSFVFIITHHRLYIYIYIYLNSAYNSEGQTRGSDWLDGAGKNVNRASFSIRQRESSMYGPPAGFDLASNYDGGDQQQHDYRASQFTMDTQY